MTDRGHVALEVVDGGVAIVTLDRPQERNAFDVAMRDELWEVLLAVRDHPDVVTWVLAARGEHFCVGADLREFGTAESLLQARNVRLARPVWELLWTIPKPAVAALRGYTLGSGLEMALFCDSRLAAPHTLLALPEARFGFLPAAGGTQTMTRVVGRSRATPAVLRGNWMSAEEALDARLVDAVEDDVEGAALDRARQWARLGPTLTRAAKTAVRAALDLSPDQGLSVERRLARVVAATGRALG